MGCKTSISTIPPIMNLSGKPPTKSLSYIVDNNK
jgi:hypothetical protein